jgi:hypothetical protein
MKVKIVLFCVAVLAVVGSGFVYSQPPVESNRMVCPSMVRMYIAPPNDKARLMRDWRMATKWDRGERGVLLNAGCVPLRQ